MHTPELLEVPWFEHKSGSRRDVVTEEPVRSDQEDIADETVEERLQDLGYVGWFTESNHNFQKFGRTPRYTSNKEESVLNNFIHTIICISVAGYTTSGRNHLDALNPEGVDLSVSEQE